MSAIVIAASADISLINQCRPSISFWTSTHKTASVDPLPQMDSRVQFIFKFIIKVLNFKIVPGLVALSIFLIFLFFHQSLLSKIGKYRHGL